MFSNSASIYTVEDTTFQDIHTGFSELVSDQPVRILNEERVENVYEKIKELEQDGLIQLYYYPDRPEKIPEDDSDLINVELRMAQIRNRKIIIFSPQFIRSCEFFINTRNRKLYPV